jgi:5'-AMP-activated protein kinase catalytic alpha subunit
MTAWRFVPECVGKYRLGSTLGRGASSLVRQGADVETGEQFAVKIIPRTELSSRVELARFEHQVELILHIAHPGVVKIIDFLADEVYFYLVMNLVAGDTLLSYLETPDRLTQDVLKSLTMQLLCTLEYLHDHSIAHRDLKLENIMVGSGGNITLIDLGFSRFAGSGQMLATPCGSPVYVAPEVLSSKTYDGKAADMWSCGVILYALATRQLPWDGRTALQVYKQITDGQYEVPDEVDPLCADLIRALMTVDWTLRLTAKAAKGPPWLSGVEAVWAGGGDARPAISVGNVKRLLEVNRNLSEGRLAVNTGAATGRRNGAKQPVFGPGRGMAARPRPPIMRLKNLTPPVLLNKDDVVT